MYALILRAKKPWQDLALGHGKDDMVEVRLFTASIISPCLFYPILGVARLQQWIMHSIEVWYLARVLNGHHVRSEPHQFPILVVQVDVDVMSAPRENPVRPRQVCKLG